MDWWDVVVVDWCPAVHHTSGVTPPFSHICNWCELHYILWIFAKILFMIVLASNPPKNKIWKSWSGNLSTTVDRIRSGLFKMCWILPVSSLEIRILYTSGWSRSVEIRNRLFGLAVSVWANSVWSLSVWPIRSSRFGQAVSVTGHFCLGHSGHDISVHKQLITLVYWSNYIGRRNVTLLRLNLNCSFGFEVFVFAWRWSWNHTLILINCWILDHICSFFKQNLSLIQVRLH